MKVLPVRWLSPEALLEEEHSMKSSVFSWAWLAWEILTQAAIPHAELTDHQVSHTIHISKHAVSRGTVLEHFMVLYGAIHLYFS